MIEKGNQDEPILTEIRNQSEIMPSLIDTSKPLFRTKLRLNQQKALDIEYYVNFPQNWFIQVTALNELNIVKCSLKKLESTVFENLINLELLDLSCNSIEAIDSKVFVTNRKLREINLSDNKISELGSEMFSGLSNMKSLDISKNCITEIPNELFRDLVNLVSLHLFRNKINFNGGNSTNVFNSLKKLEYLDLHNNCITEIPNRLFHGLVSLKILKMSRNQLKTLGNNCAPLTSKRKPGRAKVTKGASVSEPILAIPKKRGRPKTKATIEEPVSFPEPIFAIPNKRGRPKTKAAIEEQSSTVKETTIERRYSKRLRN